MIPNFFGPPEYCNLQNFRQASFTFIMKLLAESIFMILLWLCSQQWWTTISIMATAWNHNCKCICFPLILVLLIQAPCYGSITKEQRFLADLFLMHSGSTHCFLAVYSFTWWKFGIKVNSLSDIVYLVIKCVPLYTVLRLWCLCQDCFVLPVTEEITHLFPASKFPDTTDLHAPTNNFSSVTVIIFPEKS